MQNTVLYNNERYVLSGGAMTVKELIIELQKLPQDLDVIDSSFMLIDGVKVIECIYGDSANPNAKVGDVAAIY